ncbi:hypothetical protein EV363DRAFT_1508080 [Boletus edulis]|nr:hypothetical protein EV363DRAFT_1508080 [Boletus edulis]
MADGSQRGQTEQSCCCGMQKHTNESKSTRSPLLSPQSISRSASYTAIIIWDVASIKQLSLQALVQEFFCNRRLARLAITPPRSFPHASLQPHPPLCKLGTSRPALQLGGLGSLAQSLAVEEGPTPPSLWTKLTPFPLMANSLWDFFLPYFRCPHHVDASKSAANGCVDCIIPRKKRVIYSFGFKGESSFEADIMKVVPGCELYGYGFSVNSFGPEIELESDLNRRSHFFSYGLGPKDAFTPADNPKFYSLRTLMRAEWPRLYRLKVDIEGGEFDSLEWEHFPKFFEWWEKLEAVGLRSFFFEPNLVYVNLVRGVRPELIEYSFINIRGSHELISDRPLPRRNYLVV